MSEAPLLDRPLPLAARWLFTLWIVIWVTIILLNQGPQNFFWLCNIAQFIVLVAVWTHGRMLLSSQIGLVVMIGLVWTLDLLQALTTGGATATITAYMFSDGLSLTARLSSLYHVGLPLFCLWMARFTGLEARALLPQVGIVLLALIGSARFTEAERNINWVAAPFFIEDPPVPELVLIPMLAVATMLAIVLPGHWLVARTLAWMRRRAQPQSAARSST